MTDSPQPGFARNAGWFLSSLVAVIAVTALATQAPIRVKLPVLFPIIWGMLLGWGLIELRKWWGSGWSWGHLAFVGMLILGSQAGVTAGWYLAYLPGPQEREQNLRLKMGSDPAQNLVSEFLDDNGTDDDPETALQRENFRKEVERVTSIRQARLAEVQYDQTFPGYLKFRIKTFAEVPPPWPIFFWSLEILAGCVAGCGLASWSVRLERQQSGTASEPDSRPVKPENAS